MVLEYPSPDDHQPPSTSRAIHHQISGSTQLTIPSVGYMAPRFQDSINVRESMWKEIEKERIREEIIAEEVARRRMLELEVRRELMMEEDRRFASLDFSTRFPFLNQQANTMSLVSGLGARHATEQIPEVPFQHRAVEPNVSTLTAEQKILQVQPSLEPGLRKESGVLLVRVLPYCRPYLSVY
ncbi:uncharacterized protein LOC132051037 [Lycium ferocissimum]|uniref:uncharacterized protein LOC132051037 n=1 Tax=Lycium ferocissimum TaxID=112874 RepID=UPI0028162949|nr:uncharacterized protein LOC132051037 [Lycium ferocissimum]